MEPTKIKVVIGEFPVTDTRLQAVRISLGQGVNIWIHMNFEHRSIAGDKVTLIAEIPNALSRPAPIE